LHYIEIKSKDPKAIPLLLLHGWPGSFLGALLPRPVYGLKQSVTEFLEAAPLLAASTSPAFHIVVPSLPGYAFSAQPPTDRDMGLREMASVTNKLMLELGYKEC
jgi:microsomal epoxide hydrolase